MNAQYKLNIHIKGYKSSNLPHQNTPTSQKIVDELARGHKKKTEFNLHTNTRAPTKSPSKKNIGWVISILVLYFPILIFY